jgi:hypothetical protein
MPGQVEGRQLEDKGHSVQRLTPIAAAQTIMNSDMCSEQRAMAAALLAYAGADGKRTGHSLAATITGVRRFN